MKQPGRWRIGVIASLLTLTGCVGHADDDAALAARIRATFHADPLLRSFQIAVRVVEGEVTLTGDVSSAEAQLRAYKLAFETRGVNAIRDQIFLLNQAAQRTWPGDLHKNVVRSVVPSQPVRPATLPPEQPRTPIAHTKPLPEPPWVTFAPRRERQQPNLSGQTRRVASTSISSTSPDASVDSFPILEPVFRTLLAGSGPHGLSGILKQWFSEFSRHRPGVSVSFLGATPGAALRQLKEGSVDFLVSGTTLTDAQLANLSPGVKHVPILLHAVAPIYRLPDLHEAVNFPASVLADIFRGKITRWNDAELRKANLRIPLPDEPIQVVFRSDASPTASVWSSYLAIAGGAASPRVGIPAASDTAMLDLVELSPYSLGYADVSGSSLEHVSLGAVENGSHRYVRPTPDSIAAAAASPLKPDPSGRLSILNSTAKDAYPVCDIEWLILRTRHPDPSKRRALAEMTDWLLTKPRHEQEMRGYVALPEAIARLYLR